MGNKLSLCFGPSDADIAPDDWKNWDGHPAARHYVVGKQIGSGGFSEVYLAKRKPILFDGEEVALKVIFLGNPKLADTAKELLQAESAILQRLHHPNVVDVRRTFMWQAKQILVIEEEMLHGEELLVAADEAISDYGFQMTESFAARVMRQVLRALAYLHSRKVLHRDIKTENLRITRPTKDWVNDISHFEVKLIDFGLSCVMDGTQEVGWLGTAGYIAPEVIEREPHSPAMDVYAAGVVLFILLTGMKPVDNEGAAKLAYSHLEAGEYPNMIGNARWDAVSGRAQSLVLLLLQRDPRNRPSAQQALQHPFLKKGDRTAAEGAAAVAAAPQAAAASAPAAPAAPAATASAKQRLQAAEVKETDRLQVDGGTVNDTIQAERWRELITIICQKALRRGYARSQRNTFQFSAGRATAAAPPRPRLPRSTSLTSLQDGAGPLAGGSPIKGATLASPASSAHGSMRGDRPPVTAATEQRHRRAVAHEQLVEMVEEHMLTDTGAVEGLHRLEQEASM